MPSVVMIHPLIDDIKQANEMARKLPGWTDSSNRQRPGCGQCLNPDATKS